VFYPLDSFSILILKSSSLMVTTRSGTEATPPAESAPSTPVSNKTASLSKKSSKPQLRMDQAAVSARVRSTSKTRDDVDAK
jgi:hypothetical protein